MKNHSKNSLEWLAFDSLSVFPNVIHGSFLRKGGVSLGPYASLNVGDTVGDDADCVLENQQRIADVMGLQRLCFLEQEHKTHGYLLDHQFFSEGAHLVGRGDMFFTQQKGVGLVVRHADCQACLLYDPVHDAIGAVHAGWRGIVVDIYVKAIDFMVEQFGSRPSDIIAAISPSLGPKNAEFINFRSEFPQKYWKFRHANDRFDLWELAVIQLQEKGLLERHIALARMCTYAQATEYFSARRERITGRHATVIAIT